MGYDPTQAGDPIPRKFKNVVKCIADEIVTMAEAVSRGRFRTLPEGVGEGEPYWDLCFETLDAKRTDGSPLSLATGGKLFTKEGKQQDNTQRPYRLSVAFAGVGISVFPGDPEGKFDSFCAGIGADAIGSNPSFISDAIVGRVFLVEMEKMEIGRDMPLPITAEPEGYIYTGKVREVAPKNPINEDGAAAPSTNSLVDILAPGNEEPLKMVLNTINGQQADGDGLFDLLRGVASSLIIDGESVTGAALNDVLAKKLQEAGHVTIEDGKISVSAS